MRIMGKVFGMLLLVASVFAVSAFLPVIGPETGMAAEKMVVKMVVTVPIQHYITRSLEMYKDIVEKKAGDRVTFQLYPGQQLYNDKDIVSALPKKAVEGAIINPDLWSGLVRSEGILYFECYFPTRDKFYKIFNSEAWSIIAKEFEEKANVKILSTLEYGAHTLLSKKPISKLEDLKGIRMRANGEYPAIFLRALGAAPTVASSSDVYLMLQRGTVDGVLSSLGSFVDRKWFEVAKNYLDTETHVSGVFMLGFNLDFWKQLAPDLQKVFTDAAIEIQEWTRKRAAEDETKYRATLKEKGLTFTRLDAKEWERWRTKAAPELEAAFKKTVGEETGRRIIDIAKKTCF
jgi:TRAP-type C4-dicarboxylate transport system substrate-binding protein